MRAQVVDITLDGIQRPRHVQVMDLRLRSLQILKRSRRDGLQERHHVGQRVEAPPFAGTAALGGFVASQGTRHDLLLPVTAQAVSGWLRCGDDALGVYIIEGRVEQLPTALGHAVDIDTLRRIDHQRRVGLHVGHVGGGSRNTDIHVFPRGRGEVGLCDLQRPALVVVAVVVFQAVDALHIAHDHRTAGGTGLHIVGIRQRIQRDTQRGRTDPIIL